MRRLGLSRKDGPPNGSLLSTFKGDKKPRPKEPIEDDAPPLSTDDEEETKDNKNNLSSVRRSPYRGTARPPKPPPKPRQKSPDGPSDSSGDDRAGNANIQSTKFIKQPPRGNVNAKSETQPTKRSKDLELRSVKRRRFSDDLSDSREQARAGPTTRAPSTQSPTSSADHLKNSMGFTRQSKSGATYGNRKKGSQSTQSSQGDSVAKPRFRKPEAFESPKKAKKTLVLPGELPDSPVKEKARLKRPQGMNEIPGQRSPSPVSRSPPALASKLKSTSRNSRRGAKDGRRTARKDPSRSPSPPRAVFIMPAELSHSIQRDDLPKDGDALSAADLDYLSDDTVQETVPTGLDKEAEVAATLCPWCGEPVDEGLLKDFSKGKRLNVRMQTKFCQKHKKHTAMETWESRGYPEIVWPDLDERLAGHRDLLLGIINGDESLFRTKLAADVEAGKARSMRKEENLNPGYYGPRGFNLMCDYLVREFGSLLKLKAVDDRVIAGRGSAAFIQSVLVAELAVQLIMEDMKCDIEEARSIMEESKALGEIVHEES